MEQLFISMIISLMIVNPYLQPLLVFITAGVYIYYVFINLKYKTINFDHEKNILFNILLVLIIVGGGVYMAKRNILKNHIMPMSRSTTVLTDKDILKNYFKNITQED